MRCQGKILDKHDLLLYDTSGVKAKDLTEEADYGRIKDGTAL